MQRHTLTKVREINGNFFLFYPLISTVKVRKIGEVALYMIVSGVYDWYTFMLIRVEIYKKNIDFADY